MKILTISIAAYNVQKYIEECLNSFISDQLYETLEVLIINDGSTDDTPQIAQQYADKYPQIFKLIHKENGGHGSTINTAIKLATGKYFKPVDGDDWIDTKNLIYKINKLQEVNLDLVITDFNNHNMRTGKMSLKNYNFLSSNRICNFDSQVWKEPVIFHSTMYRSSLLKDNNISFSENIYYEDTEYSLYPIKFVNKFYYFSMPLYQYRVGLNEQSTSVDNIFKHKKDIEIVIFDAFIFFRNIRGISKSRKIFYKIRIHDVLKLYYNVSSTKRLTDLKTKNKKEKSMFYKDILFISPSLFISFILNKVISDKIQLLRSTLKIRSRIKSFCKKRKINL
jgi:glycosyltransferase involved in cell wall biosynthesis